MRSGISDPVPTRKGRIVAASHSRRRGASGSGRRTYVIDTSVLLADPHAIYRFDEHEVVIPVVVVTELEGKRHHPELGYFARTALRSMDELRIKHGRLDAPIPIGDTGGTIRVELNHTDPEVLPPGFRLLRRYRGATLLSRGRRRRRRGWLAAGRFHRFITLPHVVSSASRASDVYAMQEPRARSKISEKAGCLGRAPTEYIGRSKILSSRYTAET